MSQSTSFEEEIVRLLILLIKKENMSQTNLILQMHEVGFGTKRIGELLGTTRNTVNVTIQKAKKRSKKD